MTCPILGPAVSYWLCLVFGGYGLFDYSMPVLHVHLWHVAWFELQFILIINTAGLYFALRYPMAFKAGLPFIWGMYLLSLLPGQVRIYFWLWPSVWVLLRDEGGTYHW